MTIQNELNKIKTAVLGKDVRTAIHDSIKKTYDDATENGNANMEVEMARGTHPSLNRRLEVGENNNTNVNTRIDNIIATPTTISEQEIIDARQSKASLGANLTAIKDEVVSFKEDYTQQNLQEIHVIRKINHEIFGEIRDELIEGKIIKRVGYLTLKDSDIKHLGKGVNVDFITFNAPSGINMSTSILVGISKGYSSYADNLDKLGNLFRSADGVLGLIVEKDKYLTLEDAKVDLVGRNVAGQLEVPLEVEYPDKLTPNAMEIIRHGEEISQIKKIITEEFISDFENYSEIVRTFITQSKNILSLENINIGYSIAQGVLTPNINYSTTDYIPVKEGTDYKPNIVMNIAFYDTNKQYLTQGGSDGKQYITSPINASYMRAAFLTTSTGNAQIEEGRETTHYEPYRPDTISKIREHPLDNRKILFIGDSNTHLNSFPKIISERTGAICFNGGLGATRLIDYTSVKPNNNYDKLNGCAIADAIATQDFSILEGAANAIDIAENQNLIPKYASMVQNIKDACTNIYTLDAIVVKYGTNDVGFADLVMGDKNSLNTFEWNGAINYFIKTINQAYPHIEIFFCSPVFRERMPGSLEETGSDKHSDEWTRGLMLPDMVDELRTRCKEGHIKFKDIYNESGINKYTASYYLKDKTHYSTIGDLLISRIIENFLQS